MSVAIGVVSWGKKRLGLFILEFETLSCLAFVTFPSIKLLVDQTPNPNAQKSVRKSQYPFAYNVQEIKM